MSKNIFDDESQNFFVLLNQRQQYSLWPVVIPVPQGWDIVYGQDKNTSRAQCVAYIDQQWSNITVTA